MSTIQDQIGSVCARALEIAQLDSSFLTLARQYYNQVIHELSSDFDWPYFRKQASDVVLLAGQREYDLPTDYNRSDTCYLVDTNNNRRQIIIMSKTRFDQLGRSGTLTGDPRCAYIDLGRRKIVFDSSPSDSTRYYRLTYFRQGVEVADNGTATGQYSGDTSDIDFEHPPLVVTMITARLLDYTDDERAQYWYQKADKEMGDSKMNMNDEDDDSVMDLASSRFRSGRRPTRGGGGGFFVE